MLNPLNFKSLLVLILDSIRYKDFESNNTTNIFIRAIAIMNLIVIAQFFETIYISIFDHLLAAKSNHRIFLRLMYIYFRII